jgi:hypothetical protein
MRTIARSGEGLKDSIPAVLFVLGVSSFAFCYGILVGAYGYFPYEILHAAKSAADALREKHSMPEEPYVHAVDHHKAGVTIYDPDRAFDGYTFLTGYRDGLHRATLIDMEGRVLHEWSAQFSDIWPEAPHVIEQAHDAAIHWHGAYLFANGDILFNFESGKFPVWRRAGQDQQELGCSLDIGAQYSSRPGRFGRWHDLRRCPQSHIGADHQHVRS